MKTIGILGGLGPESTANFYRALIRRFQERFYPTSNADYPHIIINSIPAPDLVDSDYDATTMLDDYTNGLSELGRWGAGIIVIACNSAYCFIDVLKESTGAPIIDVPWELRRMVAGKRIAVFASPTTLRCGLYNFSDCDHVSFTEEEVVRLGEVIRSYNVGFTADGDRAFLHALVRRAADEGRLIVAGCTEIAAMLSSADVPFLDPMQVAIDVLLTRAAGFQRRESAIHGEGIFTDVALEPGQVFYRVPTTNIARAPLARAAHFEGCWFIDEQVLDWVNHSCDPNIEIVPLDAGVGLRAIRDIKRGEELVCDYSRTEKGGSSVPCSCQSQVCLGTFSRIDPQTSR